MSTIDRDPLQKPIQEHQLPDPNNVLPSAPDSTAETEILRPRTDKKKMSNNKKIGLAAIGGVVGLGIVGGAIVGPSLLSQSAPEKGPSDDQEPTTSETTNAQVVDINGNIVNTTPTAEQIAIDGSLLDQDTTGKAAAEAFANSRLTQWYNAGATPENARAALDSGDVAAYAQKIAAENGALFAQELLIAGWEDHDDLVTFVNSTVELNANALAAYFATSFKEVNPADITPYMRGSQITKVDSYQVNPDGSVTMIVEEAAYDNDELNRVGEELSQGTFVDESSELSKSNPIFTFVNEDGKLKLSQITPRPLN